MEYLEIGNRRMVKPPPTFVKFFEKGMREMMGNEFIDEGLKSGMFQEIEDGIIIALAEREDTRSKGH